MFEFNCALSFWLTLPIKVLLAVTSYILKFITRIRTNLFPLYQCVRRTFSANWAPSCTVSWAWQRDLPGSVGLQVSVTQAGAFSLYNSLDRVPGWLRWCGRSDFVFLPQYSDVNARTVICLNLPQSPFFHQRQLYHWRISTLSRR
jgi:hypothetical protein